MIGKPWATESRTTDQSEQLTQLSVLAILCIFFVSWFVAHGVSVRDAIVVIAIIGVQVAGGSALWSLLQRDRRVGLTELLGMGFAIGAMTSTVADQLLLDTPVRSVGWLIPLFASSAAWFHYRRHLPTPTTHNTHNVEDEIGLIAVVVLCVFLGRGILLGGWFWGTLTMSIGVVVTLWFHTRIRDSFRVLVFGTCALLGAVVIYWMRPTIGYGSWMLHPLYTGTDDQVFSEGFGYSLAHFGPFDHASAVHSSVRYHWFSLAWSGMVGRVGHIAPFVMTLHVAPAIAFAGIAALLIALAQTIKRSRALAVTAVIIVFATNSAPESLRFFYVLNTTNVMPHVWILAFAIAFSLYLRRQIHTPHIVLAALAATATLAKMPYAAVLVGGTVMALAISFIRDRRQARVLLISVGFSWIAMVITYVLFLSPHDWEQRSYSIVSKLTYLGQGTTVSLLLIGAFFATRFAGVWNIRPAHMRTDQLILVGFMVGSIAAGFIRFIVNGNSAEYYFINAALVLGAGASAWGINLAMPTDARLRTRLYIGAGAVPALFMWWILSNWDVFESNEWIADNEGVKMLLPLAVSVVAILITATIMVITHKPQISATLLATASLALVGSSVGVFIHQARQPIPYRFTTSVASTEDIAALTWLRHNSKPDEIIATNRYLCPVQSSCEYDDSSFLITAVANRRVLIEGPRFVVGGRPYPSWVNDRIDLSLAFANSPSQDLYERLRELGVTWFYFDSQFAESEPDTSKTMTPWGSVAYHTGQISIIKLRT